MKLTLIPLILFFLFNGQVLSAGDLLKGFEAYSSGDYQTAHEEWSSLAESGDPIAQTSLAIMYQLGQGVQINHPKAFALLQNAARKGYVPAQTSLGSFYEKGVGVPLDNVRAYMWYYIASSSDAVSRTLLEIMKQTVNSNQINTAMLLAEECVNSNFVKC